MSAAEIHDLTHRNRLLIADFLDSLSPEEWRAPSLCAGWSVGTLAAHLLQPMTVSFARFFLTAMRHRGDTDRTVDDVARRLARRPREETLALLRRHAADRVSPPRVGPMGPFAETCVHLRDIARPLGAAVDVPREHWTLLLDHLASPGAAAALVPAGRLTGLRLEAADADWAAGSGSPVRGPVEALAMAVTGRAVALADLTGPGVEVLAKRMGAEAG
ncbi:maleylpyruvate isomerase family mycothiol-dependent enzyme [Nocardioides pantholopis]|uniref:maleylpyruvate isomerase family mycothiol-dependent enzyme n=1 Tax=Nocardioides pantholopis TaxID=2483798 RepID=UPI000F08AAD6|nr:maleylpyruvate isomerase family mycothiol-dependent enzyme [Nocardioides pantholopis]